MLSKNWSQAVLFMQKSVRDSTNDSSFFGCGDTSSPSGNLSVESELLINELSMFVCMDQLLSDAAKFYAMSYGNCMTYSMSHTITYNKLEYEN